MSTPEKGALVLLTAVDDRQLLEDVVGVAVVVVDQQRPHRHLRLDRFRRLLSRRPPRREAARGTDPTRGGGRHLGRQRGPPRRRRRGEAEGGGHRGGARGGSGREKERKKAPPFLGSGVRAPFLFPLFHLFIGARFSADLHQELCPMGIVIVSAGVPCPSAVAVSTNCPRRRGGELGHSTATTTTSR